MADPQELIDYPPGQVSYGSGQLQHCESWDVKLANGASLKHSLRKSPSGVTFGNHEVTGSLSLMIPRDGAERDFITPYLNQERIGFAFEIPEAILRFACVLTELSFSAPDRSGVKLSIAFTGKLTNPAAA